MDVCFRNGRNDEAFRLGNGHVLVNVPLGVDDDGLFGFLEPDEIGVLGKSGIEDLTEQHEYYR